MRLLVTGGAGFIGSVVSAMLLERGDEVTVLDDLSTGHRDAVPAQARFVEGSVLEAGALSAAFETPVDAVLHFAAKSVVPESVADPALYWRTNVVGTLELVEAMRRAGVPAIVFSSTAAVYGEPDTFPITESAPTVPTSPYGASKLGIDYLLGGYATAYGLAATSLRYFNVAGAYGKLGERHPAETHLIPAVLAVAAGRRDSIRVYGTDYPTPDGTAVRDYVHVADLARAHLLALEAPETGRHRVYNLGNGSGYSVREVVETCRRVTGRPIPAEDAGRRAGDPARLVASYARATAELGWTPQHDLQQMVADAWELVRD